MKKFLPLLLLPLLSLASPAAVSPFQIGIRGEKCQFVATKTPVLGLRLNLPFSENDTVWGLDVGLVSFTGPFDAPRSNAISKGISINGISLGLVAWTGYGYVNGIQISAFGFAGNVDGLQAGGINVVGNVCGSQFGLYNLCLDNVHGLQLGTFNGVWQSVYGSQIGLLNVASALHGAQTGLFSAADNVHGLQVGLVNFVRKSLRGLQLGLLNIDRSSAYPYLPLLRLSF